MLFSITTTHQPATDLGYLLHKHPDRVQRFELTFGEAHVFYPVADEAECRCTLMVNVDPVELSRGRRGQSGSFDLYPYVNDRPYVASSFMSVAIAEVFGSALNGRSRDKPELVEQKLPLVIELPVVQSIGGADEIEAMFAPLGWNVQITPYPLDASHPEWGTSRLFSLRLEGEMAVRDALGHLYLLLPVLDNRKHYWVGDDEIEKLMRHGERWLADHPKRERIVQRYMGRRRSLVQAALQRLMPEQAEEGEATVERDEAEQKLEAPIRLHTLRLEQAVARLVEAGARRVLDLGCGEGQLIRMMLEHSEFTEIVGVDVSHAVLARAESKLERVPQMRRDRVRLLHGSLVYRDERLRGYDAAALLEVIEHLDPWRLDALRQSLFAHARPRTVIVTTPNSEYNAMWESLPAGRFRHADHRFEWTREEFERWGTGTAEAFGYGVGFHPIGEVDSTHGAPTQMALFTLAS